MSFKKGVFVEEKDKKQASIISTIIGIFMFVFFFVFFMPFISFFMMLSAFVGIIVIIIFFIVFFLMFRKIRKSINEQLKTVKSDFESGEVIETEMDERTRTFQPRKVKLPGQSSNAFSIIILIFIVLFVLGFIANLLS